jgi:hypothetical protein
MEAELIPITINFIKDLKIGQLDISKVIQDGIISGKFCFAPSYMIDREGNKKLVSVSLIPDTHSHLKKEVTKVDKLGD